MIALNSQSSTCFCLCKVLRVLRLKVCATGPNPCSILDIFFFFKSENILIDFCSKIYPISSKGQCPHRCFVWIQQGSYPSSAFLAILNKLFLHLKETFNSITGFMVNTEYPVQVSCFSETAISGVDLSPQC